VVGDVERRLDRKMQIALGQVVRVRRVIAALGATLATDRLDLAMLNGAPP
jgi:hypothetical protein